MQYLAQMAVKTSSLGRGDFPVGRNVRELRKRAKLTQEDLAEMAGLSRATIAGIELGRWSSVEYSTIAALARALKVNEGHLMAMDPPDNALLQAFLKSPWSASLRPSQQELEWLNTIPPNFFGSDVAIDHEAYAELLLLRRHTWSRRKPAQ